ncbi:MAG: Holliday junction branch migration protein RuvA [Peptococcia bacterium]
MLDFIQGELIKKEPDYVVLLVGGIGYRLMVSAITLAAMPTIKNSVTLYTHLHVREDELTLYGFATEEEKELFAILLSVSGIGPKLAMAVLSKMNVMEFKRAIILGDTAMLTTIPGVGKKTAERMILELKDKVGKLDTEADSEMQITTDSPATDLRSQAVTALLALGYSLAEAQKAVPLNAQAETVEDLVRLGLKNLARF